jgi:hypothetical protein
MRGLSRSAALGGALEMFGAVLPNVVIMQIEFRILPTV